MSKSKRWPVYVAAGQGLAVGTVVWASAARRRLTLIAKARLDIVHEHYASMGAAAGLLRQDVHREGHPMKSLAQAADMAPHKTGADVVLVGHAHAPEGEPCAESTVRLAVYRDGLAVIDKSCRVLGDRASEAEPATPFERMPLVFERTVGGASHPVNPVGLDAKSAKTLANLVHPERPDQPASFGPLASLWRNRQYKLPEEQRRALRSDTILLPKGFDWEYFRIALEDQRCDFLAGDEWLVLEGVHPRQKRVQTRLPVLRAEGRVWNRGQLDAPGIEVPLAIDTLSIDADAMHIDVLFRGSIEVDTKQAFDALAAGIAVSQQQGTLDWSAAMDELRQLPAPAPKEEMPSLLQTMMADGPQSVGSPFPLAHANVGSAGEEPEGAGAPPVSEPAVQSPGIAPAKAAWPSQATKPAALRQEPSGASAVAAATPAAEPPEIQKPSGNLAGTFYLSAETMGEPERSLPFAEKEQAPSTQAGKRMVVERSELGPPPDFDERGDSVPTVRATPLHLVSYPWLRKPDSPELVVAIKGSFDLLADKPARLREESAYPDGDHFFEDDVQASLIRASDYAIAKPRADVLLVGTAYAADEATNAMQVVFRFGELGKGKSGFERRMNVYGDRHWESGRMSQAMPFEKIPLRYELAYGGSGYDENPVGCGREADELERRKLPNLEWAERPIRMPSDERKPAGFGPISPMWKGRLQHVGSFGKDWLDTRWPYFPADFNYSFFNVAPLAQQVETIAGAESYRIDGMRPDGKSIAGELPKLRARCFAQYNEEGGGQFRELPLTLDTCSFDLDDMRLDLVWRGRIAVSHDTAPELQAFFVMAEHAEQPAVSIVDAAKHYRASVLALPHIAMDDAMEVTAANDEAGVIRKSASLRLRAEEQRRADQMAVFLPFGAATNQDKEPPSAEAQSESEGIKKERMQAFMVLYEANESLAGLNLSYLDLRQLQLCERDLAQADLQYAQLNGVDLTGAVLSGAQLGGADMSGGILDRADLEGADLTAAILDDASLVAADLEDADLTGIHAHRADFTNAVGDDATFVEADLSDAVFVNVAMAGLDLSDAGLDGCDFSDANLSALRLYAAHGKKVRFHRSDMSAARADDCAMEDCEFEDALLSESTWENSNLSGSSFVRCDLRDSSFVASNCQRTLFGQADLREAQLRRANFEGATLIQVNAMGASFEEAVLNEADLRGSNLHGVETWKAKLAGTSVEGALVSNSRLGAKA